MKILVTGGSGMVGQCFTRICTDYNLDLVGSKDYNLTRPEAAWWMIKNHKPDAIIHLAAKVGGIKGNTDYTGDFYLENILINTNVLEAARFHKVRKVISLLSTCIYPDRAKYPLDPSQIHNGPPHKSNFGYAYAKRMLDVQSRAYRQQYGCNFITAIPNNLYGLNDNFDLENGHVIPAIIRKIYEAKITGQPANFWGTGFPLREFTFADDIAKILLLLLDDYDCPDPINIGSTGEISIGTVVENVCKILDYGGEVFWDKSKPEGQRRKPSCNLPFVSRFPDFKYIDFDDGLKRTCEWFLRNYPNIRGV